MSISSAPERTNCYKTMYISYKIQSETKGATEKGMKREGKRITGIEKNKQNESSCISDG